MRAELFKFNLYLFPGKLGLIGMFDSGRIWANNESSKKWHYSYGIGPWINIFDRIIINGVYSISPEEKLINFKLGYFF